MAIYLDNCSTSCLDSSVLAGMQDVLLNCYGNPSSLHDMGSSAMKVIQDARYSVASLLAAPTETIYFTSGATESNNIAILGGINDPETNGYHIVVTAIEHSSVLQPVQYLANHGYEVSYIYPDPVSHEIKAEDVINAVRPDTVLVSIMSVNNETGDILPLHDVIPGIRERNRKVLIHCDATQSLGKMPFRIHDYPVDYLSATAHKIHGPKGVGMLYIRKGRNPRPLKFGGAQEGSIIPGTENVAGICGFGIAAVNAIKDMKTRYNHVTELKNHLRFLVECNHIAEFNEGRNVSPYIMNISAKGIDAYEFVEYCSRNGLFVSSSSACSRGAISYVIDRCGYDKWRAESAIRIGFSHYNTFADVDMFVDMLDSFTKRSS